MDDAKAKADADRKALADAKTELGKLHTGETSKAVLAQEARLLKASSEDLFSRMASELIGDDSSPAVMLWVRRSVAMMCVFAAMAGSLYAFCSVKAPARKVEAPAAGREEPESPARPAQEAAPVSAAVEIPDEAVLHFLARAPDNLARRAKRPALKVVRPRGRPRKLKTASRKGGNDDG
jgi:hypothetical protein